MCSQQDDQLAMDTIRFKNKSIMSERTWTYNQRVSDTKQFGRQSKKKEGQPGLWAEWMSRRRYRSKREPRLGPLYQVLDRFRDSIAKSLNPGRTCTYTAPLRGDHEGDR